MKHVAALILLAFIAGCSSGKNSTANVSPPASKLSASSGGMVGTVGSARLEIPPGALAQDAEVSVQSRDTTSFVAAETEVIGSVWEFKVGGAEHYTFKQPVTIRIPCNVEDATLAVWEGEWKPLSGVRRDGADLVAQVSHFSAFGAIRRTARGVKPLEVGAYLAPAVEMFNDSNVNLTLVPDRLRYAKPEVYADVPFVVCFPFEVPYRNSRAYVHADIRLMTWGDSLTKENEPILRSSGWTIRTFGLFRLDGEDIPSVKWQFHPSAKSEPCFRIERPWPTWIGQPTLKADENSYVEKTFQPQSGLKDRALFRQRQNDTPLIPSSFVLDAAKPGWYVLWVAADGTTSKGWPNGARTKDTLTATVSAGIVVSRKPIQDGAEMEAILGRGKAPAPASADKLAQAFGYALPVTLKRNGWIFDRVEISEHKKPDGSTAATTPTSTVIWKLKKPVKVDPNKKTGKYPASKYPEEYDELAVSATTASVKGYRAELENGKYPLRNFDIKWTFGTPPDVIRGGEPIKLEVSGTGSKTFISPPGIRTFGEFKSDAAIKQVKVENNGAVGAVDNGWNATASVTYELTAPAESSGKDMVIRATLGGCGVGEVAHYIYEAVKAPKTETPSDSKVVDKSTSENKASVGLDLANGAKLRWSVEFPGSIPDNGVNDVLVFGGNVGTQDSAWDLTTKYPEYPKDWCGELLAPSRLTEEAARADYTGAWFHDAEMQSHFFYQPWKEPSKADGTPLRFRVLGRTPAMEDRKALFGKGAGWPAIMTYQCGPWNIAAHYKRVKDVGDPELAPHDEAPPVELVEDYGPFWKWHAEFSEVLDDNKRIVRECRQFVGPLESTRRGLRQRHIELVAALQNAQQRKAQGLPIPDAAIIKRLQEEVITVQQRTTELWKEFESRNDTVKGATEAVMKKFEEGFASHSRLGLKTFVRWRDEHQAWAHGTLLDFALLSGDVALGERLVSELTPKALRPDVRFRLALWHLSQGRFIDAIVEMRSVCATTSAKSNLRAQPNPSAPATLLSTDSPGAELTLHEQAKRMLAEMEALMILTLAEKPGEAMAVARQSFKDYTDAFLPPGGPRPTWTNELKGLGLPDEWMLRLAALEYAVDTTSLTVQHFVFRGIAATVDRITGRLTEVEQRMTRDEADRVLHYLALQMTARLRQRGHTLQQIKAMPPAELRAAMPLSHLSGEAYTDEEMQNLHKAIARAFEKEDLAAFIDPNEEFVLTSFRYLLKKPYYSEVDLIDLSRDEFLGHMTNMAITMFVPGATLHAGSAITISEGLGHVTGLRAAAKWLGERQMGQYLLRGINAPRKLAEFLYKKDLLISAGIVAAAEMVAQFAIPIIIINKAEKHGGLAGGIAADMILTVFDTSHFKSWLEIGANRARVAQILAEQAGRLQKMKAVIADAERRVQELNQLSAKLGTGANPVTPVAGSAVSRPPAGGDPNIVDVEDVFKDFVHSGDAHHDIAPPLSEAERKAGQGQLSSASQAVDSMQPRLKEENKIITGSQNRVAEAEKKVAGGRRASATNAAGDQGTIGATPPPPDPTDPELIKAQDNHDKALADYQSTPTDKTGKALREAKRELDGIRARLQLANATVHPWDKYAAGGSSVPPDLKYVPGADPMDCVLANVACILHADDVKLKELEAALRPFRSIGRDGKPRGVPLEKFHDALKAVGLKPKWAPLLVDATGTASSRAIAIGDYLRKNPASKLSAEIVLPGHGPHNVTVYGIEPHPVHGAVFHILDPVNGHFRAVPMAEVHWNMSNSYVVEP